MSTEAQSPQPSDPAPPRLVRSVEPGEVFASLRAYCVPGICDDYLAVINDATPPAAPPTARDPGGFARLARLADASVGHNVEIPFEIASSVPSVAEGATDPVAGFETSYGVATFVWHRRIPSSSDRRIVGLLVELAVRTVQEQRVERAAQALGERAAHLERALRTNRTIGAAVGIVMSGHRVSGEQAFELLRLTSQHRNRKLRDLAEEVLETGWLDPQLLPEAGRTPRSGSPKGASAV